MRPAQKWTVFGRMGLVFPSHILALVFIPLPFPFHPLSRTNQNNPPVPRISFPSDGMTGSDASPESRGLDVRAQNLVPLASGTPRPPRWGTSWAPQDHPKQERHGPVPAAPPAVLPETPSSCHSVLPVADLWQGREWDPSHRPQRHQAPTASREALAVTARGPRRTKSLWRGGETSRVTVPESGLARGTLLRVSVLCVFGAPPQPPQSLQLAWQRSLRDGRFVCQVCFSVYSVRIPSSDEQVRTQSQHSNWLEWVVLGAPAAWPPGS